MRVRDMHMYMCDLCFACLVLCGLPWVGITLLAVFLLLTGAWLPLAWVGGTSVVYGGLLFMITYLEARTHWKRKVGQNGNTCAPR